jgi:hypothetical protein
MSRIHKQNWSVNPGETSSIRMLVRVSPQPHTYEKPKLLTALKANAVARQDHLEFLEDVVPKTVPYKAVKAAASETQARLRGETKTDESQAAASSQSPAATTNGNAPNGKTGTPSAPKAGNNADGNPSDQLELEMRQAHGSKHDADVQMTG